MCRLRKRLREYYKSKGSSHAVEICLPARKYAAEFRKAGGAGDVPLMIRKLSEHWVWGSALLGTVLLAVTLGFLGSRPTGKESSSSTMEATPAPQPLTLAAVQRQSVRILAGATKSYFDQDGQTWGPDRFFEGGSASEARYARLMGTTDPMLFRNARQGHDFSYSIPLEPGVYELRLYFAESSAALPIQGARGEATRVFRITANGRTILGKSESSPLQFDIFADAGGADIADVRVATDMEPASDGKLHLRFIAAGDQPALVNAIEIVPGLKSRMLPVRFRSSDRAYTDTQGRIWLRDRFFQGGRLSLFDRPIGGTTDADLYRGERFGHFTYSIPVAPGRYKVSLRFAENYHTVWSKRPGAGARLFNVYMNGVQVLRAFDVFSEAGGALRALTRTFRHVEANPQGKIVIMFQPVTDYAFVNAIEVSRDAE